MQPRSATDVLSFDSSSCSSITMQNAGRARDINAQVLHVSQARKRPYPEPLWWSNDPWTSDQEKLSDAWSSSRSHFPSPRILEPKFQAIPDFRCHANTHLMRYINWAMKIPLGFNACWFARGFLSPKVWPKTFQLGDWLTVPTRDLGSYPQI